MPAWHGQELLITDSNVIFGEIFPHCEPHKTPLPHTILGKEPIAVQQNGICIGILDIKALPDKPVFGPARGPKVLKELEQENSV